MVPRNTRTANKYSRSGCALVASVEICCNNYPGLGNRSVFYPYIYSSGSNTFTFGVVEDTGSNLTSNFSFIETLARASLNAYISLLPQASNRSG